MLAVGEALPPLPGRRRAALPIDVARTISDLFESAALDLCHVHEPFAPSVASTALRHSRALNVGTFHAPTERVVATQVARKVVQLVFGRLDARTATYRRDRRPAAPLLPGRVRDRRARRRPAPPTRARRRRAGPHRLRRAGGARRPAALPALAAPARSGLALGGGRPLRARRRPRRRRCAPTCSSACASSTTPTRRSRAPTCSSPPPTASRPRPGSSRAPRRPAPCRSPRAWPSTRRRWATARPGCSSSPTTSRRSPRSSAGWSSTATCASACARRRGRGRGAWWPTSSRPSTARSPRAATAPAATPRSPAGCRAGPRSTSTCTCTPTTATTARPPSRCCWPRRAPRAWARSR